MHGAQLGFSAAARELEAWLLGCQQRLAAQALRAPCRTDATWRKEYDVIEEARCLPCLSRSLGQWLGFEVHSVPRGRDLAQGVRRH